MFLSSKKLTTNLSELAYQGALTVAQVNEASKSNLEQDRYYDCTVLYMASCRCSIEVVQAIIIDKNVDVNGLSGTHDISPLMGATYNKKYDIMRLLLSKGADATWRNKHGSNVLHYAGESGAPNDVILTLLNAGADGTVKGIDGLTPAEFARERGHTNTGAFIEQCLTPMKSANFIA
jgi:ankyrin repeat protein